jgi:hypothetical protein
MFRIMRNPYIQYVGEIQTLSIKEGGTYNYHLALEWLINVGGMFRHGS